MYFVYRVCERWGLAPDVFLSAPYAQQLQWLVYDQLRREETAASLGC